MKNSRSWMIGFVALLIVLASCSPSRSGTPSTPAPGTLVSYDSPPPNFSHIFIIILENKESSRIVDNPAAPYLNRLAAQYGRALNYYGLTHPSLPNYLALIGGDTFGVSSDCLDCFVAGNSLVDQLEAAGRSWKAYMESMPEQPCFVGDSQKYKQKHNPFIYFDHVRFNPERCRQIVPLTQLDADLQSNALPDFVWITPNICNDMHDCGVDIGDNWLKDWVPKILASTAWQNQGVLFITFDEGESDRGCCTYAAGGQIDTLVISPLVWSGFTSDVAYDHYSLLRTIEEAWGLPLLRNATCDCSQPMIDFFQSP